MNIFVDKFLRNTFNFYKDEFLDVKLLCQSEGIFLRLLIYIAELPANIVLTSTLQIESSRNSFLNTHTNT